LVNFRLTIRGISGGYQFFAEPVHKMCSGFFCAHVSNEQEDLMKFGRTMIPVIALQGLLLLHFSYTSQGQSQTKIDTTPPNSLQIKVHDNARSLKKHWDSLDVVYNKLPSHMKKLGSGLRELIGDMKNAGITAANAKQRLAQQHFYRLGIKPDNVGLIRVLVWSRGFDMATINLLISNGAIIEYYVYDRKKGSDHNIIRKLKNLGASVLQSTNISVEELCAKIPFDAIEEVAKISKILTIDGWIPPSTNVGQVTSKGDTVINSYLARDYFNINGNGVKVGIISRGITNFLLVPFGSLFPD
jgi:hypothetical protein